MPSIIVRKALLIVALVVATRTAHAQYYPVDFTQQTFSAMNISTNYLTSQALLDSANPRKGGKPTSTTTSGKTDVVRKLAASYPVAKRADAEKLFTTLLEAYPKLEKQFDIPAGDIAGAFTLCIVGSYEAYNATTVDPARIPRLIKQVRGALTTSSEFAKASREQKRELYNQMVIIGMFMVVLNGQLTQHPDPQLSQTVRTAAKGYLVQLLKTDPDKLQIDENGLAMR